MRKRKQSSYVERALRPTESHSARPVQKLPSVHKQKSTHTSNPNTHIEKDEKRGIMRRITADIFGVGALVAIGSAGYAVHIITEGEGVKTNTGAPRSENSIDYTPLVSSNIIEATTTTTPSNTVETSTTLPSTNTTIINEIAPALSIETSVGRIVCMGTVNVEKLSGEWTFVAIARAANDESLKNIEDENTKQASVFFEAIKDQLNNGVPITEDWNATAKFTGPTDCSGYTQVGE